MTDDSLLLFKSSPLTNAKMDFLRLRPYTQVGVKEDACIYEMPSGWAEINLPLSDQKKIVASYTLHRKTINPVILIPILILLLK